MSEPVAQFVRRREADWKALDAALARVGRERIDLAAVEQLDRLYRRSASDLAFVQAHYPGSDVERYLTELSARAYGTVYRRPAELAGGLRQFFTRTFPTQVRALRDELWLAAALFVGAVVLAAVVVAVDDEAARTLVPQHLRDSVAAKQLWTDRALRQLVPSEMATAIFLNNLRVCFTAAAGGLTFGALTVSALIINGLSLGGVAAHCANHGLLPGLLDFISAHGPVELSVVVISGAAGLSLARGLVFPGELPRVEALRRRAQPAIAAVLGCAPLLVGIGVIEGFVSPGPLFPTAVKLALGLALGAGLWAYLLTAGRDEAPAQSVANAGRGG